MLHTTLPYFHIWNKRVVLASSDGLFIALDDLHEILPTFYQQSRQPALFLNTRLIESARIKILRCVGIILIS